MSLMYWFKEKIVRFFAKITIYKYPSFIMFGSTSYKMKGEDVRDVINILQPGDILLRRYDHFLTGLMIPGYFTHAAIYQGNNQVIHMLGDGIEKQDILTFCRCDSVAIIHCNDEQITKRARKMARDLLAQNVKYDYAFNFSDKTRFSCTELINLVYDSPMIPRKNKNYITPDDFLSIDKSLFEITYRKGH